MASLWQEFVDTVDAQISVDNGMFYNDLRGLMFWPLLPFIIATPFVADNEPVGSVLVAGMVLIEIPWVIFLFKRRAVKNVAGLSLQGSLTRITAIRLRTYLSRADRLYGLLWAR